MADDDATADTRPTGGDDGPDAVGTPSEVPPRSDAVSRRDTPPRSDTPPRTEAADRAAATLALTREELRTTFEYQVQRLQEIDAKAIEILKANLLLIGIVVTGGSVLVQTGFDVSAFVNAFTLVGGLLLLVSTGLSAVTYTASNLRGGLDLAAVERAIADAHDERADPPFEERLLRSYARWIEYNARVTAVNDLLATVTVLLVFVAFVYVVVGIAVAGSALGSLGSLVVFGLTTLLMAAFTWGGFHMDHLGPPDEPRDATFAGIRLSKGATRREGLSALRDMLDGEAPNPPAMAERAPADTGRASESDSDVDDDSDSDVDSNDGGDSNVDDDSNNDDADTAERDARK